MTWGQERQDYFSTLAWATSLMRSVEMSMLDLPTPCSEFSVRLLMGHLIGTVRRALGTGNSTSTRQIPHVVTDIADDELAETYAWDAGRVRAAWSPLAATDEVTAPWGPCRAEAAARGFALETLAHGWDLAVATGQPPNLDDVAQRCLENAGPEIVPDRLRGVMYDPPRRPNEDSATERLVHLLGRKRP